jgi:ABC-type multidrug transport system fused ATPase/permease subunit
VRHSHKLWGFLNKFQKRRALIYLLLSFGNSLMETVGVGLVIPLLGLMTEVNVSAKYPVLKPLLNFIGAQNNEDAFFVILGLFVLLFFIRFLYALAISWYQTGFALSLEADIAAKLYKSYINQPWSFYYNRNSSEFIQNVITESAHLKLYGFIGGLNFVKEILLITALGSFLLIVEPVVTLTVAVVLLPFTWLMQQLSRIRGMRWGKIRQENEQARLRWLKQGLETVKELLLSGRQAYFLTRFEKHNQNLVSLGQRQGVMRQLNTNSLEFVSVATMGLIIVILVRTGNELSTLAPTLGAFALAALRLMPSMGRILSSIHGLRYISPTIRLISREMNLRSHASFESNINIAFEDEISVENVSHSYETSTSYSLDNVSLSIPSGSFVALVGESGAGKSTLIDIILGLVTPTIGEILVDGINIQKNVASWKLQIGYVSQKITLIDDTLRRNIALGFEDKEINEELIQNAINSAQLNSLVQNLRHGINSIIGENGVMLSGGERQRIGIARALYNEPSILVLDEATRSLDAKTKGLVMEAITNLKGKHTIIMVTHDSTNLENCDIVYKIEHGKVASAANET